MERLPVHIARFIGLFFIQIFLLKNIGIYNLSTPFIYCLFLLLLPFKTPNWLLFLLAFLSGLVVDVFHDTLGLHAVACTTLAFARILFINLTVSTDDFESEPEPNLSSMGARWFLIYTLLLTFIHHFFLFTFELFRFADFGETLLRTLLSTLFSVLLMFIFSLVFYRKKAR